MKGEGISELIRKAKATAKTPQQEVCVVNGEKEGVNKDSIQIAFYIPSELYKKVKRIAFEKEESIKSILNQSIEKYISDIS